METDVALTIERLVRLPGYADHALPRESWAGFTKRHFDNEKVGSHTAIIPTVAVPESLKTLSDDERLLYDLLVKSLLKIVYPKAEREETELVLSVEGAPHRFKCKGSVTIERGWKLLETVKDKETELPVVAEHDLLWVQIKLVEGETEPPKRFTEASLILAMELAGQRLEDEAARELMKAQKKGLGTDATRAATIGALFDEKRNYLRRKGKTIFPTDKGSYLIDTLTIPGLKSAEMTGEWEKRLNDIAEAGDFSRAMELYSSFLTDIKAELGGAYEAIKACKGEPYYSPNEVKMLCPFCGARIFNGKFGYACSGYNEGCKFQIKYEICGKKITSAQAAMLLSSGRTSIIKGFKSKNGNSFDAILKLDRDKKSVAFEFPNDKR